MPWCPNCRCDFEEGVRICSYCGSELVDELDLTEQEKKRVMLGKPLDKRQEKPKDARIRSVDEVLLMNVSDRAELAYITSMLEQENIAYRVAEEDVGQYMSIVQGRSYMGSNIYVSSDDYASAMQMMASMDDEQKESPKLEHDDDYADEVETLEEAKPYRGSVIGKRIVQGFLALMLFAFIAALIIGLLL